MAQCERRERFTRAQADDLIRAHGLTPSAAGWEDEEHVFGCSVESCGPAAYGAARCAVHFGKATGWLTVTGGRIA